MAAANAEVTPRHVPTGFWPGLVRSYRVNSTILKTCVEERLVYRTDFALATLLRFLPMVTQIFLWTAIFAVGTGQERGELSGYTYHQMISYYLVAMLGRAFSSMPGLASGIASDVRDGSIKKYLTQPIDLLGYLFWYRVAHKLVYYGVALVPFAVLFIWFREHLPPYPGLPVLLGFLASLVMAFLIGFLVEAWLGLVAFWFLEVGSLLFVYMLFSYFLSGHMIPLDFFPPALRNVMLCLPLQYMAFFPAAVLLGRVPAAELPWALTVEFLWVVGLFIMCRWTLARGLKRYGAYGG